MAIDAADLPLLFGEARRRPFSGSVLTLGRQDVTVTLKALARLAAQCGFPVPGPLPKGDDPGTVLDDVALLRALGFESVASLDVNDYEGATFIHDLNAPAPPAGLEGRFDVVFDRGTAEHVFHLPNLLANMVRMIRPPGLFRDYCRANGLAVEQIRLVRHPFLQRDPIIEIYDYRPGALAPIAHGGLDDGSYQVFCVATRAEEARWDRVPQQSFYVEAWAAGGVGAGGARGGRLKALARSAMRAFPPLYRLYSSVADGLKKRHRMPRALPLLARYRIKT